MKSSDKTEVAFVSTYILAASRIMHEARCCLARCLPNLQSGDVSLAQTDIECHGYNVSVLYDTVCIT
jgi:hypothetical protein